MTASLKEDEGMGEKLTRPKLNCPCRAPSHSGVSRNWSRCAFASALFQSNSLPAQIFSAQCFILAMYHPTSGEPRYAKISTKMKPKNPGRSGSDKTPGSNKQTGSISRLPNSFSKDASKKSHGSSSKDPICLGVVEGALENNRDGENPNGSPGRSPNRSAILGVSSSFQGTSSCRKIERTTEGFEP